MENLENEITLSNETNIENIDKSTTELEDAQKESSLEENNQTPSESVDIQIEDANKTNCLALTIQEDHKLVAIKNVFIRSIRMSWKVVVSAITLAIIKLFT